jgi:hypothetical protein
MRALLREADIARLFEHHARISKCNDREHDTRGFA